MRALLVLCCLLQVFIDADGQTARDTTGLKDTVRLTSVEVRASRPPFQSKPEGLVVNVENSPLSKGSSALEILERSPGVLIDRRNNSIALNGKNGVSVMINGKLMRMSVEQLVTLLGGMSGNDIERIELLTSPSAAYDAEGSAGIINIVLKRSRLRGTNGSASVTGGYGWREKGAASLTLTRNTAPLDLYGTYTFSHDRPYGQLEVTGYQDFPALGGPMDMAFLNTNRPAQNNHRIMIGADHRWSPEITIGGSLTFEHNRNVSEAINQAAYTILPDSTLSYYGKIRPVNQWRNLLGSLYIERRWQKERRLILSADWLQYRNTNGSSAENSLVNEHGAEAGSRDSLYADRQRSYANSNIDVGVIKLDYAGQPGKTMKLEAGVKGNSTITTTRSAIENQHNGEWITNPGNASNMRMTEAIGAAYLSLNKRIDSSLNLTLGLRYEYAFTRLHDLAAGTITVDRRLSNLFPNILLSKKTGPNTGWTLSYTKRISRPSYNDLASFVAYSDPTAVLTGNPLLRPTITNNVKLGYSYKSYSFSLIFSRDLYPIYRFQLTESSNRNVMYVAPQNGRYQDYLSFQTNLPVRVSNWWTMTYGFTGGWRRFAVDYTKSPLTHSYFGYNLNVVQSFLLPASFSAELSGWYNGKGYNGSTVINGFGSIDLGVKKQLAGNAGSLQLALSDPFRLLKGNGGFGTLTEEAFNTRNRWEWRAESIYYTVVKLTYTRSFGHSGTDRSVRERNGSSDERDRIRN